MYNIYYVTYDTYFVIYTIWPHIYLKFSDPDLSLPILHRSIQSIYPVNASVLLYNKLNNIQTIM